MAGTTPKRCFVIAPIGDEDSGTRRRSDKVLKHIIVPVVEPLGYKAVRADQISEPGIITTQVIQRIAEDPLVIADLTEWNPNVFYELALRHALRKPLVQMIAKGERIPFDVAGMRTVEVDVTDLDSVEESKQEIGRQITALEANPDSMETPLSVSIDLQTLRQSGDPEGRSLAELVKVVADVRNDVRSLGVSLNRLSISREPDWFATQAERDRIRAGLEDVAVHLRVFASMPLGSDADEEQKAQIAAAQVELGAKLDDLISRLRPSRP